MTLKAPTPILFKCSVFYLVFLIKSTQNETHTASILFLERDRPEYLSVWTLQSPFHVRHRLQTQVQSFHLCLPTNQEKKIARYTHSSQNKIQISQLIVLIVEHIKFPTWLCWCVEYKRKNKGKWPTNNYVGPKSDMKQTTGNSQGEVSLLFQT